MLTSISEGAFSGSHSSAAAQRTSFEVLLYICSILVRREPEYPSHYGGYKYLVVWLGAYRVVNHGVVVLSCLVR